jgi:class 3 adenylate cyclase/tetratricopeptide (TPR) repeat protein
VKCATCGAENEAGRKFCLECGARLAAACPSCGEPNPPAAKFCGECGARLGDASRPAGGGPVAEAGPTEAAGPVAERRLVSVLFADIVGFTPFAEARDPEEVRELLSRYFDLSREVIERHGGTVEKFIGDAVMAVWGAPTSHEDDAERAVRTGLELLSAVHSLGPEIQARAGILTGEAAVTIGALHEGMVAGDLVNTASRLQSAAPPGTVLVGEATMRAASGGIAFEEAGEQTLKGKAAPVPAWRALRVVAEVGGRNRAETLEAPFVGRDDEFRLIKDLFHATARDRRIRLVSVSGQGGIGKSRLAWEFLKYIDGLVDVVYWHHGRSPSYGSGITFWALGEMVRERAGLVEGEDDATTRQRITETVATWARDEEERRRIEVALLALLGVGEAPPGGQDQLFGAWRTFFECVAEKAPVVMVFEDLQWADTGLLAFIDHLVEWSRNAPIYVLGLTRPELFDTRPDWGAGKRNFTSLALEPLSDAAMGELLAGLVPGLPADAAGRIVARAEGIPLYAVEIVRMLVAHGKLVLEDGVYRPVDDLSDVAVPETLQSLIAARLDALEPAERSLLQTASVLGQSFSIDGLVAMIGSHPAELERQLAALVRREILVLDADPRSSERGQYAFVQSLVREVAYGTLSRRDRKSSHLAAARYFEALLDDELAGALAAQYLAAYRNSQEGPEADALAAQARLALRAAGERAASLGAWEQALGFFRDALEVTTDPHEQAGLLERAGAAASAAAHHEEAEELWTKAIEGYRRDGDRSAAARAYAGLADAMMGRWRFDAAISTLEPVAEEFADLGDDPGLAALLGQLARFQMLRGLSTEAISTADRALVIAERLDLVSVVADALITRGVGLYSLGRAYEGIGAIETGMRLADEHGLVDSQLRARTNLGGPLSDRDVQAQLAVSRSGLELARRLGHRQSATLLLGNSAAAAHETGEWGWAVGELRAAMEAEEAEQRVVILMFLIEFLADRGEQLDEAADEVEAWIQAHLAEEPHLESSELNIRAQRARARGDFREAARRFIETARLDRFNADFNFSEALLHALLEADVELARAALDGLVATGSHGAMVKITRRVGEAGLAAIKDGQDPTAALAAAFASFGELGAARKQLMTGAVLAALHGGDNAEARPVIDEARRIGERLGARLWLDVLDAHASAGRGDRRTVGAAATPDGRHDATPAVAGEP